MSESGIDWWEKGPRSAGSGVFSFPPIPLYNASPCSKFVLPFSIAVRDRMVPPPPPPHHLYAKANTSSSIFLHWRRPAFTTAQVINYTIRCNPVGLQNASLVLYLQTYVACLPSCLLGVPGCSCFLLTWAQLGLHQGALLSEPMISNVWKFRFPLFIQF